MSTENISVQLFLVKTEILYGSGCKCSTAGKKSSENISVEVSENFEEKMSTENISVELFLVKTEILYGSGCKIFKNLFS